jgi:DNA repair exonuclease SbcCD ATPase subunit
MTLIAEINPPVPWSVTGNFVYGLLGLIGVLVLVLTVVEKIKSVFGRKPPLEEEMKGKHKRLFGEIEHAKNSVKKELRAEMAADRQRLNKLEEYYEDMQIDRERKWQELKKDYHALEVSFVKSIARLEEALKHFKS